MSDRVRNIDEEIIVNFGRNLCAERNRRGLSQDGLGRLAFIDGRYISRIERGEINPTLTTITALIDALGIEFEELRKPTK